MLCSKCNKRPAVVFVSNSADGQSKGYCLTCAKELGIKSAETIRKACVETWRTSCGFKWRYKKVS